MIHRHLNHQRHTRAAIDDIIERGLWDDWMELLSALHDDPQVLADVKAVASYRAETAPRGDHQRYVLWAHYAAEQS